MALSNEDKVTTWTLFFIFLGSSFFFFSSRFLRQSTSRFDCSVLVESNPGKSTAQSCSDAYAELEELLSKSPVDYQQADIKTALIFQGLSKSRNQRLHEESIDSISCSHLIKLDDLWMSASEERFGLTVQVNLWSDLGGQPGIYTRDMDQEFRQLVNWLPREKEIYLYNDSAAEGHLPGLAFGEGRLPTPFIAKKMQSCRESVLKSN